MSPCLLFQKLPAWQRPMKKLLRPLLSYLTRDLIGEDAGLLEHILVNRKDFSGMKLEAYDAPIVRVRRRLLDTQEFGDF